jgi:hypothetical protein
MWIKGLLNQETQNRMRLEYDKLVDDYVKRQAEECRLREQEQQAENSSAEVIANVDPSDAVLEMLMNKADKAVRKQMNGEFGQRLADGFRQSITIPSVPAFQNAKTQTVWPTTSQR